jgi:energy-coupling factor transporter ATP-binding protein EcfA2
MHIYTDLKASYIQEINVLKQAHAWISIIRIVLVCIVLVCFYFFITGAGYVPLLIGLVSLVIFPFILVWHRKKSSEILFKETLIEILSKEISYLENKELSFESGAEYNDINHPYAFDLDIFGHKSLFQHLNRTASYLGKKTLAQSLQRILPNKEIVQNQEAINELSDKLEWRLEILARAKIANDNKEIYHNIAKWASEKSAVVPVYTRIISFVLPIALICFLITSVFADSGIYLNIFEILFVINLIVIGLQYKLIKSELIHADKIEMLLKQYSLILSKIETENVISARLTDLKHTLIHEEKTASGHLDVLSKLFARVETIQNAVGSVLMNGFFLYHIHSLHALLKWKAAHANKVLEWIGVIAEIEMLNSYANLSYNNRDFVFPELNTEHRIELTDAGHPLIDRKKRICNDVVFHDGNFIILTGSNMSGKSTFLRTLGVNMVLAGAGAPICASAARIHPLPVIVSMRLSDSLSDSESYFFAEVKRLKQLMHALDQQKCFVLLDEILRGTNSDDKRSGTIEVLKKILVKRGIGIVATHDLEVCNTTVLYPEQLSNKCFEVEIINDELVFDYKLRAGICKNKSATFLMKKMGVI